MYHVTGRRASLFGRGTYIVDFIADTETDVSTLPTATVKGSNGLTANDNKLCAAGSTCYIIAADASHKVYMLNTAGEWVGQ